MGFIIIFNYLIIIFFLNVSIFVVFISLKKIYKFLCILFLAFL